MGFPLAPNPGDTYSAESRVWTYDGYGWRFLGASGSVNVTLSGIINYTIGNTAPSGPNSGDKWFHIDDGVEYTFITDYDSTSHWIEIGYGCPTIGGGTGINFPNTECSGDIYEYDSRIWVYKGYAWKMVCQNAGDSEFTFGLTAPPDPNPGHRWVDSATGYLYTWVDDGDPAGYTGQWVMFGGGELVGPAGPTGATGAPGVINFTFGSVAPTNPSVGDQWYESTTGSLLVFMNDGNSSQWVETIRSIRGPTGPTGNNGPTGNTGNTGNTGSLNFTFGSDAPANPNIGDQWYESTTGTLLVFMSDGNSSQWVETIRSIRGPTGPIGVTGPTGDTIEYTLTAERGISYTVAGYKYNFYTDLNTTNLSRKNSISGTDLVLVQSAASGATSQRATVDDVLNAKTLTRPSTINTFSSTSFMFFDPSDGGFKSATFGSVQDALLSSAVTSLNGCTGSIGITGVSGEIEITTSCPTITVGLPNNVTISGDLFVGGDYGGIIDGGVFV